MLYRTPGFWSRCVFLLFTLKFLSSRSGLTPLPVFCLEMYCLISLCLLCLDIALLLTLMLSFHWTRPWLQDRVPYVLRAYKFIGTLGPSTCSVLVARSCVLEKNVSSLIVSSNRHSKFENVNMKGKTKKKKYPIFPKPNLASRTEVVMDGITVCWPTGGHGYDVTHHMV